MIIRNLCRKINPPEEIVATTRLVNGCLKSILSKGSGTIQRCFRNSEKGIRIN